MVKTGEPADGCQAESSAWIFCAESSKSRERAGRKSAALRLDWDDFIDAKDQCIEDRRRRAGATRQSPNDSFEPGERSNLGGTGARENSESLGVELLEEFVPGDRFKI